jgi:hypothetical protein
VKILPFEDDWISNVAVVIALIGAWIAVAVGVRMLL